MRYTVLRNAANVATYPFRRATHVIFDMDGLILDTECIYTKVISDIAKRFGKSYTKDVRLKLLGTIEDDSSKIAVEEMNLPITWKEFKDEFSYNSSLQLKRCPLMPGAEKLIHHLKAHDIPMAIATSSTEESMKYKTEHLWHFFNLFDHKVCGGSDPEVLRGKPAPDVFLVCARRFIDQPDPENCLVLEDAPNGLRGAIAAGMQCIIVPDPDVPRNLCEQATQILPSLQHIRPEQFGLPPFTS